MHCSGWCHCEPVRCLSTVQRTAAYLRAVFTSCLFKHGSHRSYGRAAVQPCSSHPLPLRRHCFFCTHTPACTPGLWPHKAPPVLLRDWLTMMQWGMTEGLDGVFFTPSSSLLLLWRAFSKVIDSAGNSVAPELYTYKSTSAKQNINMI